MQEAAKRGSGVVLSLTYDGSALTERAQIEEFAAHFHFKVLPDQGMKSSSSAVQAGDETFSTFLNRLFSLSSFSNFEWRSRSNSKNRKPPSVLGTQHPLFSLHRSNRYGRLRVSK